MMKKIFAAMIFTFLFSSCAFCYSISDLAHYGTVGEQYTAFLTLYDAPTTGLYYWYSTGNKPAWMSVSGTGTTCTLSGLPDTAGEFSFKIIVNNARTGQILAERDCYIIIYEASGGGNENPGAALSLSGGFIVGSVGSQYFNTVLRPQNHASVSGGTAPYTWEVSRESLPKGLALRCTDDSLAPGSSNVGKYAHLVGVPALGGNFDFHLKVTDAAGKVVERSYSVEIEGGDLDALEIQGDYYANTTANWTGNFSYFNDVSPYVVYGRGRAPFTWSIVSGKIPTGLQIACSDEVTLVSGKVGSTTGRYAHLYGRPRRERHVQIHAESYGRGRQERAKVIYNYDFGRKQERHGRQRERNAFK